MRARAPHSLLMNVFEGHHEYVQSAFVFYSSDNAALGDAVVAWEAL